MERTDWGELVFMTKHYFQDRWLEPVLDDLAYTHHKEICDYIELHASKLLPPILKKRDSLMDIALDLAVAAAKSLKLKEGKVKKGEPEIMQIIERCPVTGDLMFLRKRYFQCRHIAHVLDPYRARQYRGVICRYIEKHADELLPPILERYDSLNYICHWLIEEAAVRLGIMS